jgi:hypothetical protein
VDPVVGEGVDGGGVLRPHHEVGLRLLPRRHLVGQLLGEADVVGRHLAVVVHDVQAGAGHVALNGGHRRRAGLGDVERHQHRGDRDGREPRGGQE